MSSYRVWLFQRPQASPREEKSRFLLVIDHLSGKRLRLNWWAEVSRREWSCYQSWADENMTPYKGVLNGRTPPCCVWPRLVERTKCSQSCVRPCDPAPATPLHSAARATLTQWHTFRTRGGGAKPSSSDVTGEPFERSRCTEHGGGWRLSGGHAACARVPGNSACSFLIPVIMLFSFFRRIHSDKSGVLSCMCLSTCRNVIAGLTITFRWI